MKKIIKYEIEEEVMKPVRKVLANISDANMISKAGITQKDLENIHEFLEITFDNTEED